MPHNLSPFCETKEQWGAWSAASALFSFSSNQSRNNLCGNVQWEPTVQRRTTDGRTGGLDPRQKRNQVNSIHRVTRGMTETDLCDSVSAHWRNKTRSYNGCPLLFCPVPLPSNNGKLLNVYKPAVVFWSTNFVPAYCFRDSRNATGGARVLREMTAFRAATGDRASGTTAQWEKPGAPDTRGYHSDNGEEMYFVVGSEGQGEAWEMWDGVSVPLSLTVFPIGASLRITAGDTEHRKCRRDVLDKKFYIIYTITN